MVFYVNERLYIIAVKSNTKVKDNRTKYHSVARVPCFVFIQSINFIMNLLYLDTMLDTYDITMN